LYRRWTCHW